jgi:hypothetical protein
MARLDRATQGGRVRDRERVSARVNTRLLGGPIKPGHDSLVLHDSYVLKAKRNA